MELDERHTAALEASEEPMIRVRYRGEQEPGRITIQVGAGRIGLAFSVSANMGNEDLEPLVGRSRNHAARKVR